jgi:hypothetical protein
LGNTTMRNTSPPQLQAPDAAQVDVVVQQLGSTDADVRRAAAAQTVVTGFDVPAALPELLQHCHDPDPAVRRLLAVAVGAAEAGQRDAMARVLAELLAPAEPIEVRIAAAHSLFRHQICPPQAVAGLAAMLVAEIEAARRIAEASLMLAPPSRVEEILRVLAATDPDALSLEGLNALGAAAIENNDSRKPVETWLTRISEQAVPPNIRLGLISARLKLSQGQRGADELLAIVGSGADKPLRILALRALAALNEGGRPHAAYLARMLESESDADLLESICRTLVQWRARAEELPLEWMKLAVATGAPRVAAAAAMLFCLGGKYFAGAIDPLLMRWEDGPESLRPTLERALETISGKPLP